MRRIIFVLAASSFAAVFEPNRGQSAPRVTFLATHEYNTIFFTAAETVLRSDDGALRWSYAGGRSVTPEPASLRKETHSYRKGADPAKWLHNLPVYDRLIRRDVYPGIDVVYHDAEYDFVLKPRANPRQIRIRFADETKATILPDGALELQSGHAKFIHKAPIAFTEFNGVRTPVTARFIKISRHEVAFRLGPYDNRQTLTIDPEIAALALFGGKGDDSLGATLATSNTFLAGTTASPEFPSAAPRARADRDIFIRNSVGDVFIIGGSGDDIVHAFAPGIIVGETTSRDFPVSWAAPFLDDLPAPPPQSTYGGGASDGFLVFVGGVESRDIRATYWGDAGTDRLKAAASAFGNFVIAGESDSTDLAADRPRGGLDILTFRCDAIPNGRGAFSCSRPQLAGGSRDDFVHGMTFVGLSPDFSLHILGETESPEWITGGGASDALLLSYSNLDSSSLGAPTVRAYGGPGRDRLVQSLTAPDGAFILAGDADSATNGRDLFALWVDPATLSPRKTWSFGGSGNETLLTAHFRDLSITLAGSTTSTDLPVKEPYQDRYGGGGSDGLLVQLTVDGDLTRASYLGGSGEDVVNRLCTGCRLWSGAIHFAPTPDSLTVSGSTTSTDWQLPVTAIGGRDIFEATLAASRRPDAQRIAIAPGVSAILRLSTPFLVPEGTPVTFAVEDPSLIRLAGAGVNGVEAITVPARAPGDRLGTTVTVIALDGAAGVTRVRMEAPGLETVWHEVTVGQMRVQLIPLQAFGNDPECRVSCALTLDFRIRLGDVDVPASLPPVNLTADTILIRNLSPSVIRFDNQITFTNAQLIRVYSTALRITALSAGAAALSVESNVARIPPYIWRKDIPAIPIGFEHTGPLPGRIVTDTRLVFPSAPAPRNVKLSSSDPLLLSLSGPNGGLAGESVVTIPAGAGSIPVRLQAHKNAGDVVVRVELEGAEPREIPISIAPLKVRFVECGRKEVEAGASVTFDEAMFFFSHPRTGAFSSEANNLSSIGEAAFRLTSSDPTIVDTSADPISSRPGSRNPLVVTAKTPGRALLSLVPLDADRLLGASGCEVVVVPRKGPPVPIVVGEFLSTGAQVALPYVVTGGLRISVADSTRAQVASPPQAYLSTARINVTGLVRGETELRIEHPGQQPVIVPVVVQPAGAILRFDPVSIRVGELANVRLQFVPVDPVTRAPGTPQSPLSSLSSSSGFRLVDDGGIVSSDYRSGTFAVFARRSGETTLRLILPDQMLAPAFGTTLPVSIAKAKLRLINIQIGERMQQPVSSPHCPALCRIRSVDPDRLVVSRQPESLGAESIEVAPDATFYPQSLGGAGRYKLFVTGDELEDAEIVVDVAPVRWLRGDPRPVQRFLQGQQVRLAMFARTLNGNELTQSFTPLQSLPELRFRAEPESLFTPNSLTISPPIVPGRPLEFVVTAARPGSGTIKLEASAPFQLDDRIDVSVVPPAPRIRPATIRRDEVIRATFETPPDVRYEPGQILSVRSAAPSRLLIAASESDRGAPELQIRIGADGALPPVFLIGLADLGFSDVSVLSDDVSRSDSSMTHATLPVILSSVNSSVPLGDANQFIIVSVGNAVLRPGASIPVRLVNSDPRVLSLETDSVTLTSDRPSVRVAVRAISAGAVSLSMELPSGYTANFLPLSVGIVPFTNRIEALTIDARALPQLGASPIRLRLASPVSTDSEYFIETAATTLIGFSLTERERSAPQVRVKVPAGSREAVAWIHSTAAATANSIGIPILARPVLQPGAVPSFFSGFVDRVPGVVGIVERTIRTSVSSDRVNLTVALGSLGPNNTLVTDPALRLSPNAGDIPLQFSLSQSTVAAAQGAPRLLAGQASVVVAFSPRAIGETSVSVRAVDGLAAAPEPRTAVVRVAGPAPIPGTLAGQAPKVGKLLSALIAIDFPANISESGIDVTVRSTNPSLLRVHSQFETAISSGQFTLRAGSGRQYFKVAALDSAGTVNVNVESPFFDTVTIPIQLTPSAVRFRFGSTLPLNVSRGTFQIALETLRLEPGTLAAADPQEVAPGASLSLVMRSDNPQIVAPAVASIPAPAGQMHFIYPFNITGTGASTTIRVTSSPELTLGQRDQSQEVIVAR